MKANFSAHRLFAQVLLALLPFRKFSSGANLNI